MGYCVNHPERKTSYKCMKHDIFLCEDCLACRDPKLYCKFRSACPIYFITEKGFDKPGKEPADSARAACSVLLPPEDL